MKSSPRRRVQEPISTISNRSSSGSVWRRTRPWLIAPVAALALLAFPAGAPAQTITVTISCDSNGEVSPRGTLQVPAHSDLSVTATPHVGYKLHEWYVDGQPGGWTVNTIQLHFGDLDVAVHVTFERITNIVHVAASGSGQVSPSGDSLLVDWGDSVQFTATPDSHYHVKRWTVDNQEAQNGGTSFMLTDVTTERWVVVEFEPDVYKVQAIAGANGSLSPSGVVVVVYGEDQVFSVMPAPGYDIVVWRLDGQPILTNMTQFTLTGVDTNHTLEVWFSPLLLSVARTSPDTLLISWPTAVNDYYLQEIGGLGSADPDWVDSSVAPVEQAGRQEVILPIPQGPRFYRLRRP